MNKTSELEIPDISMYGMLRRSAEKHPNAFALDYMGNKILYSALISKIDICAKAFESTGIKEGDIVTLCLPNLPEAVIAIYALNKLGAAANMIHPLSSENEIRNYINSTDSRCLVVIDMCADRISGIINDTKLEKIITVSASDSMPGLMKIGYSIKTIRKKDLTDTRFINWNEFFSKGILSRKKIEDSHGGDDLAVILHSGGTTGTPKEIMLSNRNFNALGVQGRIELPDIGTNDSTLAILPVFHAFGLGVCVHIMLCLGACSVLLPKFDALSFAKTMDKYKPTMMLGVPTMYEALMSSKGSDKIDLSYVKYIISGGDFLSSAFEERFNAWLKERNAKVTIIQGYGLTECLGPTCFAAGEKYKPGSIGKPFEGNSYCIVNPGTEEKLPAGKDGEICICGPTVMMGYRNNGEETAAVLRHHSDGKIWLHTGDIGYVDEDGFYFYRLRLKRLIITSGYNVYPQRIEKIIESHEAVLKCAVIGIPHPYKIEVAKAYMVLKKGYTPGEELKKEIRELCRKNLAVYSVPQEFEFRTSIPQTLLGKVDFNKLRKEHIINCSNGENKDEYNEKRKSKDEVKGPGNVRIPADDAGSQSSVPVLVHSVDYRERKHS